jgi:signal transduction histidine kinase
MAKDSADSLLDLLNDILNLSKIEAGKFEIEAIPYNLFTTLDGAARPWHSARRGKAWIR